MTKKNDDAFGQILDYTERLKDKSLDLRSKLTSLVLFTEESRPLKQEEKECILSICEIISKKNDELIFVEEKLGEVINQLHVKD